MSFQRPPGPPAFGASPPPRSNLGMVISAVAAAVALVVTLGVALWNFVLAPLPASQAVPTPTPTITSSGPGPTVIPSIPTQAPPTTTEPPSPAPPPTTEPPPPPPPPAFPPGARPCPATTGPVGGFSQAAAGTQVTSCPFAEEVRKSYGANPVRNTTVNIPAYSPVTRETYDMTCSGDRLVTCTGGNNAVVYLI